MKFMSWHSSSLLVGVSIGLVSVSSVEGLRFLPEHARGGRAALENPELLPSPSASSQAFVLSVPVDHFNEHDTRHFDDHFFVDDSCWDPKNGPIFVEMGGEGPANGVSCGDLHKRYGALAVAVEHRFYGNSIPFNDRNVSMLRYLTVEQNLADTAAIIDHIRQNRSLSAERHKVVTFGGSYSGATSAWFRMAYPHVTHASISSSGVVNAIVNFTAFDEQVAEAIDLPKRGCAAALAGHVSVLEGYAARGELDKVKTRFGAHNLVGTPEGDPDFWYMAADGAAMADQYGSKAALCAAMQNSSLPSAGANPWAYVRTTVENYADFVAGFWGKDFASGCFYDSECLKTADGGSMARSWRWQKCSQLFYLQPSFAADPVRSEHLTLLDEFRQCEYVFGRGTLEYGLRENKRFQEKFGGASPGSGALSASRIFFSDYSDDPWNRASVGREISQELPYCFLECNGCGHCGAGVPANLTKCSDMETKYLDLWLNNNVTA